ncbi:MAG: class I SAM-dependent RNA methyltransferase [Thermoanaerobaculia bacterium]
MRWVATCARGLEEIVAGELTALGIASAKPETGGVPFSGGWHEGFTANWRLRTANRVLIELASWPAGDDEALYRGARLLVERATEGPSASGLALLELFSPERTFAIKATSTGSRIRDTRWIAMKVKDAVVDAQRARWDCRSDIEREHPDLSLRLRLVKDRATLLVDSSGEPLDRRGYRVTSTAAPLRENLAAAAVLASGWIGTGPVVDPMCGSGTLLAEAASLALGLPPNRFRADWACERLPGADLAVWHFVRASPLPVPGPDLQLYGVDSSGEAMVATRRNLEAAGLAGRLTLRSGDAFDFEPPPGPGLLLVNPPHGQRLLDGPESWRRLGDLLKQRYSGWKAVVFAGGESRGKHLGLKPARRLPVWNGPLEARILVFDLW